MVKEPQRSREMVDGPSSSLVEPSEKSKTSLNERKRNIKITHRNPGGVKKNLVKLKKGNQPSPVILQILKKKRKRAVKEVSALQRDKKSTVSPRQQFAIFEPPAGSDIIAVMHPTQKEAEIEEYEEERIVKIQVEKTVAENGVNGKSEQLEPTVVIEHLKENNGNGHNNHDVIDHEEEIVDVVAIPEAEVAPVIPEAEEAPVYEDNGNGVPEEPLLMSPRLRGNAKKGPSSSRSSSPADSLYKERTSRRLSYVKPAEVPVEEKLVVSMVAELDEPLIVEGGAEDLEVSADAPVTGEKSPVKLRTPVKAPSPSRPKKTPQLPVTPVEELVSGRRSRKPKSDEKKKIQEDASPRASMSMLEDVEEYKPISGRAGSSIRSVRARRPMRRSRNISALDSSLHNQSSPWDEEYKILSPRGGSASMVDSSIVNGEESLLSVSVAQKRKVSEDELDAKETKKAKNESSHTSSFFSIVTSPICALKEKFRGGALSSSTPFHGDERKPVVESDASMLSADENDAQEPLNEAKVTPPVDTPESLASRWCVLM